MRITINGIEFNLFVGGQDIDGYFDDCSNGTEYVVERDGAIEDFIEELRGKSGVLYSNKKIGDVRTWDDYPEYNIGGYKNDDVGEIDVEELRKELYKGEFELVFIPNGESDVNDYVYFTSKDGKFWLYDVDGSVGCIFGWIK